MFEYDKLLEAYFYTDSQYQKGEQDCTSLCQILQK